MDFFDDAVASRSSAAEKRKRQLKLKKAKAERAAAVAKEKEKELLLVQEKAREERRREKMYNDTVALYSAQMKNPYKGGTLNPYSIKGTGDKIILPESWLGVVGDGVGVVTFRIGIERDASDGHDRGWTDFDWDSTPNPLDLSASFGSDDMQDDNEDDDSVSLTSPQSMAIVRHSLNTRWASYTHCGVLSFTASEGDVGITEALSRRLGGGAVRLREGGPTVDEEERRRQIYEEEWTDMEDRDTKAKFYLNRRTGERTLVKPDFVSSEYEGVTGDVGVDAWGSFETPSSVFVEVVRLQKGEWCELTPDLESVREGFYNLDDVKLTLEESISASRTTLTCGDVINVPWRGKEYTLKVTKLKPDFEGQGLGGICVINSDLEVEFGRDPEVDEVLGGVSDGVLPMDESATPVKQGGMVLGGGGQGARVEDLPPTATTTTATAQFPSHPLPPLALNETAVKIALRGHHAEVLEVSPTTTFKDVKMHVEGKTGRAVRLGRVTNLDDKVAGGVIYVNFV